MLRAAGGIVKGRSALLSVVMLFSCVMLGKARRDNHK